MDGVGAWFFMDAIGQSRVKNSRQPSRFPQGKIGRSGHAYVIDGTSIRIFKETLTSADLFPDPVLCTRQRNELDWSKIRPTAAKGPSLTIPFFRSSL